jgi:hypothetical protein
LHFFHFLTQEKIGFKLSEIMVGSGIRDPGSGKKPIPDPGVKKVPDPGSGSATLEGGTTAVGSIDPTR